MLFFHGSSLQAQNLGFIFVSMVALTTTARPQEPAPPLFADPIFLIPSIGDYTFQTLQIATGDVNNDAHPDLVVPSGEFESVFVLLNNGAGNFGKAKSYPCGVRPLEVALADLNNDGNLDAIVMSRGNASIQQPPTIDTLLGNGGGAFLLTSQILPGGEMSNLVLSDITEDGNIDLIAALPETNPPGNKAITIFASDGLGAFSTLLTVPGSITKPAWLGVADIAGSGHIDAVIAASTSNQLLLFKNNGGGLYELPSITTINGSPLTGVFCDIQEDGQPDLVLGTNSAPALSIYLNNQMGGFQAPAILPIAEPATTIRAGMINEDTHVDLLTNKTGLKSIRLFAGNGAGNFTQSQKYDFGLNANGFDIADFDHDHILDLAIVLLSSRDGITVLSGDGKGKFGVKPETAQTYTIYDIGDINLDGFPDIAAIEFGQLIIQFGNAAGVPAVKMQYPVYFPTGGVIIIRDLNLDGLPDIVASRDGCLWLYAGDGMGNLAIPQQCIVNASGYFLTADFNNDSIPDFLISPPGFGSAFVVPGLGNGNFGPILNPTNTTDGTFGMDTGDLNLDGNLDAVMKSWFTPARALMGNGAGDFTSSLQLSSNLMHASYPVLRDLDHDDIPDLVLNNLDIGANFFILRGIGNGTFSLPMIVDNGNSQFIVEDLTGDGEYDIVTLSNVFAGDGDFHFNNIFSFGTNLPEQKAMRLRPADMNGDGLPDLVTPTNVYINQTPAQTGTVLFGTGTIGCSGIHGLHAISAPNIGNNHFGIVCTGAPPLSLGLGLAADAFDPNGGDAFGVGISVYVDLFNASSVVFFDVVSDASGYGGGITNIPNDPNLVGSLFLVQMFWLWDSCNPSPLHLSSSRVLGVVVQP